MSRSCPRRQATRWLVVALLGMVLTACGGSKSADDSGAAWPDVSIERLSDGTPAATSDLLGDVPTVVTVWAVWCKPCREELPALQALAVDRAGEVAVLGVNNGDDPATAISFLDELGVEFPMYRDPQGRLTSAVGVVSLPATMIVLPDGEIAWQRLGAVSRDEIEDQLAPYLGAGPQS